MWEIFNRIRAQKSSDHTGPSHLELGARGEKIAADFLTNNNYRIVVTNFRTPIGYSRNGRPITGEIDIIAYDESSRPFVLSFIEVKTRAGAEIASPESAVDQRKQRQIIRATRIYRRMMSVEAEPSRYDVIAIVLSDEGETEVKLMKGYFHDR